MQLKLLNTSESRKRTRSGNCYNNSVVPLTDESLAETPYKRRRSDKYDPPRDATRSYIEEIPTEILQQIFFSALNGNLVRASKRIAVKLSGSNTLYRLSFFITFYHDCLLELRDDFKLHSIMPEVEYPIPYWETRSMLKLVLDSRWCTGSWVRETTSDMMKHMAEDFANKFTVKLNSWSETRLPDLLASSPSEVENFLANGLYGEDNKGDSISFSPGFSDLLLTAIPRQYMTADHDLNGNKWEEIEIRRYQLCIFGLGKIPAAMTWKGYTNNTPFKDFVFQAWQDRYMLNSTDTRDEWACLEEAIHRAVKRRDWKQLREAIELDYFFTPQDLRYTISPKVFRLAARSDNSLWLSQDSEEVSLLALLWYMDPASLPHRDTSMPRWLAQAKDLLGEFKQSRRNARADARDERTSSGGVFTQLDLVQIKREFVSADFNAKTRVDMITDLTKRREGIHVLDDRDLRRPPLMQPMVAANEEIDENDLIGGGSEDPNSTLKLGYEHGNLYEQSARFEEAWLTDETFSQRYYDGEGWRTQLNEANSEDVESLNAGFYDDDNLEDDEWVEERIGNALQSNDAPSTFQAQWKLYQQGVEYMSPQDFDNREAQENDFGNMYHFFRDEYEWFEKPEKNYLISLKDAAQAI